MAEAPKVLVVTNDFPPRVGGIQSFVHALAARLPPERVVVYAPSWPGSGAFDAGLAFPVVRLAGSLMLPLPSVAKKAAEILRTHGCDTVMFGAAAPLGLMAPALRRAGARRIIALTHGHEAGWATLPGARSLIRRIGDSVDAMSYLGEYFRERLAAALSPAAAARLVRLAPGVDTERFQPDAGGQALRQRLGLGGRPIVLCASRLVPRKGQDTLIRAWPIVRQNADSDPTLLLVGTGPRDAALRQLAASVGADASVIFAGDVPAEHLQSYYSAANVFAMPCRTRNFGLDVEGLGMVYLEAAGAGLPVITGDSGGAPDAVLDGETGYVSRGGDVDGLAEKIAMLLSHPVQARAMGAEGRAWMLREWQWGSVMERFEGMLRG